MKRKDNAPLPYKRAYIHDTLKDAMASVDGDAEKKLRVGKLLMKAQRVNAKARKLLNKGLRK